MADESTPPKKPARLVLAQTSDGRMLDMNDREQMRAWGADVSAEVSRRMEAHGWIRSPSGGGWVRGPDFEAKQAAYKAAHPDEK